MRSRSTIVRAGPVSVIAPAPRRRWSSREIGQIVIPTAAANDQAADQRDPRRDRTGVTGQFHVTSAGRILAGQHVERVHRNGSEDDEQKDGGDHDRPREPVGDTGAQDRQFTGEDAERRHRHQGERAETERGTDEPTLVQQPAYSGDVRGAGGEEELAAAAERDGLGEAMADQVQQGGAHRQRAADRRGERDQTHVLDDWSRRAAVCSRAG